MFKKFLAWLYKPLIKNAVGVARAVDTSVRGIGSIASGVELPTDYWQRRNQDFGNDLREAREAINEIEGTFLKIGSAVNGVTQTGTNMGGYSSNDSSGSGGFWGTFGSGLISQLGGYFQNKDNQQASVQQSQATANAITEGVKFLGIVFVIGFILTAVIKIFKR